MGRGYLRKNGKVRKQTPKVAPNEPIHKPLVGHAKKRKQYNKNNHNLLAHPDDKKIMKHNYVEDDEYTSTTKEHLLDRYMEKYVKHAEPNNDGYDYDSDPDALCNLDY